VNYLLSIDEESNTQESNSPAEEETLHPSPPSFDSQRSRDGSTGSEEQELNRQGSIHKESDANRPMYTELSVNCSVGDQPSKNCSVDGELSKNCSVDEGVELPVGTEESTVPVTGWPIVSTTKTLQPQPGSLSPSADVMATPQQDTNSPESENETAACRSVLVPYMCPSLPLSIRKNIVLPIVDIPSYMRESKQPLLSVPAASKVGYASPSSSTSKPTRSVTAKGTYQGCILYSNMPHVFEKGSYLPLPSQEAMTKSIGTGGNGVITNIYHKRMEFAVKRVSLIT
jgi:hypothetical protein